MLALAGVSLGLFVYFKDKAGLVHRAWMRLALALAAWSFAIALMNESPSAGWALFWARVSTVAYALVPILFLRFALSFAAEREEGYERRMRWAERAGAVFALLAATPLLVADIQPENDFLYYPAAGPFYIGFAACFILLWAIGVSVLLSEYRVQVGYRRNQLRYLIIAAVVGWGSLFSMVPLLFHWPVSPVWQGLFLFYALISYAIVRWRLMDISIVIKSTLVYTSLYSVLVGCFVVFVVFMGQWFFYGPEMLDRRVLWMCVLALSVVTAVVRPLDIWLRGWTDRYLFQKKYAWQKTLREASKGMTKVTSADKLVKLMAYFVSARVRLTHTGILQNENNRYVLKASRGIKKRIIGFSLDAQNPLITWLEEKKEVLTLDEVRRWLRSERMFPRKTVICRTLQEIYAEMQALGAHVCVPALSKGKLYGILVLGEKLSGDPFSEEDLDLLFTLASEGAIALENAQLYQQLYVRINEIEGLYAREHRLFVHTAIALASAVDARDPYTHGHTERTTAYSMAILEQLGYPPEITQPERFRQILTISGLLHDIGKIGISDEILRKRTKLTPKEMKKMQEHPVIGAIILQPIKGMEEVAIAVRTHHERFDGRGYPDQLCATEIPLVTRIISVADTFDSITTDRPYRKRMPDDVALREILANSGSQFDPGIVEVFMKAYRRGLIVKRPVEASEMIG